MRRGSARLSPASRRMWRSRCIPWNRDPPMRTRKKSRTRGSAKRAANAPYAIRSAGQRPKGTARDRKKIVTGRRKAVMKPPREKRPQTMGSRTASRSSWRRSAPARTASRPGPHSADPPAMSQAPEHDVQDRRGDDGPEDEVPGEGPLPRDRLLREGDGLGLPDEHEPRDRVDEDEGEDDEGQDQDGRSREDPLEPGERVLPPVVLPQLVEEDEPVQCGEDAADLTRLEQQVPRVAQPPARGTLPGVHAGHGLTASRTSAGAGGASGASTRGPSGSGSRPRGRRPSGRRRNTRPRTCTPRSPSSGRGRGGGPPRPRPASPGCTGTRGRTPRGR